MRRWLAAVLSLALTAASVPAEALQSAAPVKLRAAAAISDLPVLPALAPSIALPALHLALPVPSALLPEAPAAALAQLGAAQPAPERSAGAAAAAVFDGAKPVPESSFAVPAASVAALPLALHLPSFSVASYAAANALSVAFPLPQTYRTFQQGHAREFPALRAALGAAGTILLGLVNAPMLDKPFWGAMHIFIGLGMLAPYFIGKHLERQGAGERRWVAPAQAKTLAARLWARARGDGAALRTALIAAPLLAVSAGLYAAAAAVVPTALTAALGPQAVESTLLGLQLFKAALFMAVFAPDIVALIKGRPPKGFTMGVNLIFFASVSAFAAWGFTAAAACDPGPIREQYLVLALRNLGESTAAALSIAAVLRARRQGRPKK